MFIVNRTAHLLFCFSAGRRANTYRNAEESSRRPAEKQKEKRHIIDLNYKHGTPTGFLDGLEDFGICRDAAFESVSLTFSGQKCR